MQLLIAFNIHRVIKISAIACFFTKRSHAFNIIERKSHINYLTIDIREEEKRQDTFNISLTATVRPSNKNKNYIIYGRGNFVLYLVQDAYITNLLHKMGVINRNYY